MPTAASRRRQRLGPWWAVFEPRIPHAEANACAVVQALVSRKVESYSSQPKTTASKNAVARTALRERAVANFKRIRQQLIAESAAYPCLLPWHPAGAFRNHGPQATRRPSHVRTQIQYRFGKNRGRGVRYLEGIQGSLLRHFQTGRRPHTCRETLSFGEQRRMRQNATHVARNTPCHFL